MAEEKTISRNDIHLMLNRIKKAEIENAKTNRFSDKEMVDRISKYIMGQVKAQYSDDDLEESME